VVSAPDWCRVVDDDGDDDDDDDDDDEVDADPDVAIFPGWAELPLAPDNCPVRLWTSSMFSMTKPFLGPAVYLTWSQFNETISAKMLEKTLKICKLFMAL
jgi:hypothetical protein